jgi:hypothetical protein
MTRDALDDHRAFEDTESREQRGRLVPDIIVGHRPGAALLDRPARLGAVERMDLRLLVGRRDETMFGGSSYSPTTTRCSCPSSWRAS